jgi:N6-adenosine-specific RNA methylase IME4
MTLDLIRNEPVKELAAEQAHLHLWTTNAFLRKAFEVLRAWGFHYKSCLVLSQAKSDWLVSIGA